MIYPSYSGTTSREILSVSKPKDGIQCHAERKNCSVSTFTASEVSLTGLSLAAPLSNGAAAQCPLQPNASASLPEKIEKTKKRRLSEGGTELSHVFKSDHRTPQIIEEAK